MHVAVSAMQYILCCDEVICPDGLMVTLEFSCCMIYMTINRVDVMGSILRTST